MKLRIARTLMMGFTMAAFAVGCGQTVTEIGEDQPVNEGNELSEGDQESSSTETESELFGINSDGSDGVAIYLDENSGDATAEGPSEQDKETVKTLLRARIQMHKEIAECAGIDDDLKAFHDKAKAYKEEGKTREEMKELLAEDHASLVELIKSSKDAIQECRMAQVDSDLANAIRSAIDVCFEKPEQPILAGMRRPNRPAKRIRPFLPRLFLNQFDSEACQSAIADLAGYLPAQDDPTPDEEE